MQLIKVQIKNIIIKIIGKYFLTALQKTFVSFLCEFEMPKRAFCSDNKLEHFNTRHTIDSIISVITKHKKMLTVLAEFKP